MALDEEIREQLQQATRQRTRRAATALLEEDDPEGAKAHLEWAERAKEVLVADKANSPRRLYLSVVIAVICLSLTALAWTLSPGENRVTLEAQLDGVEMDLVRPWVLDLDLPLGHFRVDRLESVQDSVTGLRSAERFTLGMEQAGTAWLKRLEFAAGTHLAVEADGQKLRLLVHNGVMRGRLAVGRGELSVTGETIEPMIELRATGPRLPNIPPPPALVEFTTQNMPLEGPPLELVLESDSDWALVGASGTGFRFKREYPEGSEQMVSTVRGAHGRFMESKREFELLAGDELHLEGARSARLGLYREGEGMKFSMQGVVGRLEAGPVDFRQDLTPTWLEYLYNNQQLTFVWGALMFLWGMAWKLRALW